MNDEQTKDQQATPAQPTKEVTTQSLPDALGDLTMEARTELALLPNLKNFKDVMNLCTWVSQSNIVPQAYRGKPADVFVAAEYGAEIGLKFMQAIQNIAVINGKPALPSDIKLAMVRSKRLIERFKEASIKEIKQTGIAWCEMKRVDDPDPIRHEFTIEDAKTAFLWERKGRDGQPTPWVTYKHRMLQLKPRDMVLRDLFGDVFKGMLSVEEAQEIEIISTDNSPEAKMIEQSQPDTKGADIATQAAQPVEQVAVPKPAPVPSQPAETRRPFTESTWADFIQLAKETDNDSYAQLKELYKVKDGRDVKPNLRWQFYDDFQAKLTEKAGDKK